MNMYFTSKIVDAIKFGTAIAIVLWMLDLI